ncbi:TetR family transcriptional regulator [Flavonifractor sp. An92]|uniref:TetR/AcrR family transcriptional regulator n=1 Tax=Flavonifractor sp. An92 TaxID=1965666 RepID=UPI000B38BA6D|nr:TetR/AcrR family transcriptional regulator [Flavonifractor sp. An92]OUN04618.1 TetR family transcriptional regulator [Flavonifractor sp. An92]
MSKKQALTEFHRGSILAAAERLFAAKGTEKTTMDDIARESEYSKATLYVYFQSKEEIVNAILLSSMVLLQKKIQAAVEHYGSWIQAYDAVCDAIIRFYGDNPTAYDTAIWEVPVNVEPDKMDKGLRDILQVGDATNAMLADFLRRGAAEGVVRIELSPNETVLLFWAALSGMVRMADSKNGYMGRSLGLSRDEFLRHGARMLLDAITKGRTVE